MICAIMTLTVFSACHDDSHAYEDNGGVIVEIDCPEVTVETAHLLFIMPMEISLPHTIIRMFVT